MHLNHYASADNAHRGLPCTFSTFLGGANDEHLHLETVALKRLRYFGLARALINADLCEVEDYVVSE